MCRWLWHVLMVLSSQQVFSEDQQAQLLLAVEQYYQCVMGTLDAAHTSIRRQEQRKHVSCLCHVQTIPNLCMYTHIIHFFHGVCTSPGVCTLLGVCTSL